MSVMSDSESILGKGIRVSLRYLLVAGGIGAGLGLFLSRRRDRHTDPLLTEVPVDKLLPAPGGSVTFDDGRKSNSSRLTKTVAEGRQVKPVHRLTNIYYLRKNKRAGRGAASII